ncbi:hypothetical protein RJT34_23190 [Clitoria ternatea]|uniref:Uncharacterized protein n=1 Tax=Clitoria ternatea TaxID=43366 RepID=A0AAN9FL57_CLITE
MDNTLSANDNNNNIILLKHTAPFFSFLSTSKEMLFLRTWKWLILNPFSLQFHATMPRVAFFTVSPTP